MSNIDNTSQTSLMSLYQVGAHRGNRKSKLNPRLKSKIYGFKNGMCLIDLAETQKNLSNAERLMYSLGQKRKQILIVGTSKHLKDLVEEFAQSFVGGTMPFVDSRWLGGTLTNWGTVRKTLKTLEKLTKIKENQQFYNKLSKNEQLNISRKQTKIFKFFKGLSYLKSNKPGAVIVLNAQDDPIAIQESDTSGIPVVALANTSSLSLPNNLDYTIVTNTYSINAVRLFLSKLTESYNQGISSGSDIQEVSESKKAETPKNNRSYVSSN